MFFETTGPKQTDSTGVSVCFGDPPWNDHSLPPWKYAEKNPKGREAHHLPTRWFSSSFQRFRDPELFHNHCQVLEEVFWIPWRIPMEKWLYLPIHEWLFFDGFHVGKYTIHGNGVWKMQHPTAPRWLQSIPVVTSPYALVLQLPKGLSRFLGSHTPTGPNNRKKTPANPKVFWVASRLELLMTREVIQKY